MAHSEEFLSGNTLFENATFSLRVDTVALEDGRQSQRELICQPHRVLLLLCTSSHCALLPLWRPVLGKISPELPSGQLGPGEEPLACAQRIAAAFGISPKQWQVVGQVLPSPAIVQATATLVVARGSDKPLPGLALPLNGVAHALGQNYIVDMGTAGALSLAVAAGILPLQISSPPPALPRPLEIPVLEQVCLHEGKVLSVQRRSFAAALPPLEYCSHRGAVAVVACQGGRVALVRQYRYAQQQECWELPAGKLDMGESPEQTALRELREETGLVASKLVHLGSFYSAPDVLDEVLHLYAAQGLSQSESALDAGEFLDCQQIARTQLGQWAREGTLADAKTLVALQLAQMRGLMTGE